MQPFFEELKRRNVIRAAVAYLAAAWLLVQLLETLFPIFGLAETGIRWFVIALAIGFIPFLLLAWAFEWTSEGIRKDADVPHEPENVRRRSRRLDRTIIVVLAVAVGYFATDKFLLDSTPKVSRPGRNTIAVLPFVDLSPAHDQAYFSDGIAEELLNLLARIPQLRVAARTSSFSFKGRNISIPQIAASLNVAHVLEGSVRLAGDRLRITAQLISADDGFHLWSETYDRPIGTVFDVQEDISRNIARELQLTLLSDLPVVPRTSPEAYTLLLQGRYLERQGTPDSMERASALFEEALEIDPGYADAWVALGITITNETGAGLRPWDEGHRKARDAISRALEIDANHTAAISHLSWLEHAYEGNLRAAAAYAGRALALEPGDPVLLGNTAVLLQSIGRLDDAIELQELCLARSPVDPRAHFNLGLTYYFARRLDDAEKSLRKTLALSPQYASAWYRLGTILLFQGEIDAAASAFEREPDEEFRVKGSALVAWARGRTQAADDALATLIDGWGDQWPSEVAQVYAYRGDLERAFEWLDRAYEIEGTAGWGEWRLMLLYDNLRDDPRWESFLTRAGVSDAELATISLQLPAGMAGL